MSTSTQHVEAHGMVAAYPAGQHLECDQCGAQIRIVRACPAHPVEQVLQCCGRAMRPATAAFIEDAPQAEE